MEFLLECVENHYLGSGNTPVYGGVDFFMWGNKNKEDYTSKVIQIIHRFSLSSESYEPIFNNIILISQKKDEELIDLTRRINLFFSSKEIEIFVDFEVVESLQLTSLVERINSKNDKCLFLIYEVENYYKKLSSHISDHIDSVGSDRVESNYINLINNIDFLSNIDLDLKYLILDSDYMLPVGEEILSPLYSIEKLSMNGFQQQEKKDFIFPLIKMLEEKGIVEVIAYIEKNNDIHDKDFLKLQLLQKLRIEKGDNFAARTIENILEEIHVSDSLSIEAAIIIAEISLNIMKKSYITEFIEYIVENTMSYKHLEKVYDVSVKIENEDLLQKIEIKLNKYFPESEKIKYIALNKYLKNNDFSGALSCLNNDDNIELRRYLDFNCRNNKMIYDNPSNFLMLTFNEVPEFYYRNFLIIKEILLKEKNFNSMYFIIDFSSGKLSKNQLFKSKIELIEEIFLLPQEVVEKSDFYNLAFNIFEDVFDSYIMQDDLLKAYIDIERLLSHERSQSLGSIFLYKLLFKKIRGFNFEIIGKSDFLDLFDQNETIDADRSLDFYKVIFFHFFKDKDALILDGSYTDIPDDIFSGNQNDVDSLIKLIFRISITYIDKEEFAYLLNINMYIVYNIARKSSFKNVDLYFLTNILSKLCVEGKTQFVRDMMLNLFIFAKDNVERRKIACLAYADISLRLKDPICSLSFIVFSLEEKLKVHDFYSLHEVIVRAFRDLKLYSFSLEFIEILECKLSAYDNAFYEQVYNKILFLKISIKINEVMKNKGEGYSEFLDQIIGFYESEKKSNNDCGPIILILLQMYKFCVDNNFELNQVFLNVIDEVKCFSLGSNINNKISKLILEKDFNIIFEIYKDILNASYSENLEKDFVNFRTVIKSTLNSLDFFQPLEYLFMSEMLVDNTYSDVNSNFFGKNIKSYEDMFDFKNNLELILSSSDVYFLVLDQFNKLVVGHCSSNDINFFNELNFDIEKYKDWNKYFPRNYGFYDPQKDGNLFFDAISSINIGIDFELSKNSIIFIDPLIHSITPKVFNNNSIFWGSNQSVSLSPSIRWLSNNIAFDHLLPKNNNLKAWISDNDRNGYLLNSLASNFSEEGGVFERYNIQLERTHGLPTHISNSKLAIVAAHGGVSYTNSSFSTISDEGDLRVNYLDFAERLQNCKVVILFVCNSGRFDPHPEYSTTISLQKELLNKGCSAVIASPWPLKGFMTIKWLPKFMECWVDEKKLLQEAVFEANSYIDSYYNDPSDSLALTIYGNPFIKF